MNTKPITVVHDDTTITYNESENRWTFTLRGRDRSAESLAKAKEYIDKPLPPEKAKPFEKIPAWIIRYNDRPEKGEITGIAERRYGREQVWVTVDGKRSKETVSYTVYPSNPKNDKLIEQILAAQVEIDKLKESISESKSHLDPLVLPKDE